ncbi:MAG: outer membrane lipoprotein carrier protein LolA [Prevotellaceae bacterium]|jgi:outer membrane lipoprotein-sorting protein|nr:outer membrane lipoprotein carrier protein LolA [Prevotellaceae bacterium]
MLPVPLKKILRRPARFALAAACLAGVAGLAAAAAPPQNAKQLLTAFIEKINGAASFEMAFTIAVENPAKGLLHHSEGVLLCSGARYRLTTDESDVYCDGRSKWICSKATNEVYIQYVSDDEPSDFANNPLRWLASSRQRFFEKQKGERRTENGQTLVDVELSPKEKSSACTAIVLTLDVDSAWPQAIRYSTKNAAYTIRVTRITPDVEVFDGYFAFPKHQYPGIEIIDLR